MLIPLNRRKFEELIPRTATSNQYRYCWGSFSDVLRRVLISIAGIIVVLIMRFFLGEAFVPVLFVLAALTCCYWLWAPIYWAWQRNREYRRYEFGGFWSGEVIDKFITEELINTQETVNKHGELVLIENRERRLNLEVGDETGFTAKIQVPLKREHRAIRRGDWAEMVVVSNRPDLSRIMKVTDIYIPDANLWVSDYPYLRRDVFMEVSKRLRRDMGMAHDRRTGTL